MDVIRELTVQQMAGRVKRYIPELEYSFVCDYLQQNKGNGMKPVDVSQWLRVFDKMLIDGKEKVS